MHHTRPLHVPLYREWPGHHAHCQGGVEPQDTAACTGCWWQQLCFHPFWRQHPPGWRQQCKHQSGRLALRNSMWDIICVYMFMRHCQHGPGQLALRNSLVKMVVVYVHIQKGLHINNVLVLMVSLAVQSSSTALHFLPRSFAAHLEPCCRRICISFLQPAERSTTQLPPGDLASIPPTTTTNMTTKSTASTNQVRSYDGFPCDGICVRAHIKGKHQHICGVNAEVRHCQQQHCTALSP
jgi:hypothetical protein